jgi:uncharacterized membrane protein
MRALPKRFPGWIHARQHDERGATFVLTAICMVLLLSAGAFGVDLGFTVDGNRQAQSMADTAALDMARYINIADAAGITESGTANWLTTNKLPYVDKDNSDNTTLTVVPGNWSGSWTPETACATGLPPLPSCNAVKITASQQVPQIFGGGNSTVTRTSIAAETPESGFSIGSYLANISLTQSSILNSLLGSLDTSANVTAVGYDGLANTNVTLSQLITASGGLLTPSNVLTASLTASQWLSIWTDAVTTQVAQLNCGSSPTPYPCNASTALSALSFSASSSAQLCQVVQVNGSSCTNGTLSTAALSTSVNVLQVLTTEAELANGSSGVSVGTLGGITGVVSGNLTFSAIQPPQFAYGPVNTTATTEQVNADLQLQTLVGTLDIPVTAASATATLSKIRCQNNALKKVTIAVSGAAINNNVTLTPPVGSPSVIGQVTEGQFSGTPSFTTVPPTTSTVQGGTNPVTTTASLNYTGTQSVLVGAVIAVLAPLLQTMGVSIGGVQTADLSVNCGSVTLVQ